MASNDPRLAAINAIVSQVRKNTEQWKLMGDCSSEQCLDLQLAIGRLNESICYLTIELGEMRTRTLQPKKK